MKKVYLLFFFHSISWKVIFFSKSSSWQFKFYIQREQVNSRSMEENVFHAFFWHASLLDILFCNLGLFKDFQQKLSDDFGTFNVFHFLDAMVIQTKN